jgi:hypothetical protein
LNTCSCGTYPCNSDDIQVPSCNVADLPCSKPYIRVDSCAFKGSPADGGAD